MAKTAQFISHETDIEDIYTVAPQQPIEKTNAETLADAWVEALTSDPQAFISVNRQPNGGNGTMEFVARFPADKYDYGQLLSHLQQKYGGGDYRILLYAKGKLRANKLETIATEKNIAETPHNMDGVAGILRSVMDTMEKQNRQIMELMSQRQNPQQMETDFLNKMLMYKQLFDRGDSGAGNGLSMVRDTLGFIKDMGVTIGGVAPERETGFLDVLDKATPLLAAAMTRGNNPEPQYKQNPAPRNPQMIQQMMIKAGVKQLLTAARKGSDPAIYAEMLLDQVPEETVKQFITAPDSFAKLCQIAPECAQFQTWFAELAEHVKALLGMESTVSDQYNDLTDDADGATLDSDEPEIDA